MHVELLEEVPSGCRKGTRLGSLWCLPEHPTSCPTRRVEVQVRSCIDISVSVSIRIDLSMSMNISVSIHTCMDLSGDSGFSSSKYLESRPRVAGTGPLGPSTIKTPLNVCRAQHTVLWQGGARDPQSDEAPPTWKLRRSTSELLGDLLQGMETSSQHK